MYFICSQLDRSMSGRRAIYILHASTVLNSVRTDVNISHCSTLILCFYEQHEKQKDMIVIRGYRGLVLNCWNQTAVFELL